jgi:hypothetical protein
MRQKLAKQIRREARQWWKDYIKNYKTLPFTKRLALAWKVIMAR